jgi:hypothetical protein
MIWPLPALLAWVLAWAAFAGTRYAGAPSSVAMALAILLGGVLAVFGSTGWRRVFIAAGFPLSLAASGLAGDVSAWVWLLPLAGLAVLYPLNAWSDAPLFPTPAGALRGLSSQAALPAGAVVMDAGCGLGAGLTELRREYPQARIEGLEWSWPLVWLCRLRCRFAHVHRADIWTADWSRCGMVYLFQRPESMARAVEKATAELKPGAWLASLEFEAAMLEPTVRLEAVEGKPVWLYQVPFKRR